MGAQIRKMIRPLGERPDYKESLRTNFLPTIYYFLLFSLFGMCIGIMGPTMPHLQCQVNASQSAMSTVFLIQLSAMLVSTLATGSIVQIMDSNLLLLLNALMITLCTFLVMVARSSSELTIVLTVMGFNMGCIDTLCNVLLVNIYKLHIGPFIQVMHFLYGFGALITQLSIDPFLQYLSTNCTTHHYNIEKQQEHTNRQNLLLSYPFWIMGFIETFVFLILVIIYNIMSSTAIPIQSTNAKSIPIEQNSIKTQNSVQSKSATKGYLHVLIVVLVAGLVLILDGMQSEYNVLVYSYAVNSGSNEAERSYDSFLNFTFWGTLSIGRFVAVLVSLWCRAYALLIVDVVGLFIGVMILVCGQGQSNILYASTCIIGLCLSNATPGIISLTEEFINLTKWRTTFIIFSASVGEALLPFIFGTLMDNVGPIVFPVGNVLLVLFIMGNFFTLFKLGVTTTKYTDNVTKSIVDMPQPGETIHVKHYSRMDSIDNA